MSTGKVPFSWEEGPLKLITTPRFKTGATDQFTLAATEMALVHNCIIRAINSIYRQASRVQPAQYNSFVNYAYACFEGLQAHHTGEEELFFPRLEKLTGKEGLMEANISQHEAFHEGLHSFGGYLSGMLQTGKTDDFSPAHLINIMDAFMEPLSAHLNDEIPTILALAEYGDLLDMAKMDEELAKEVVGSLSKTRVIPAFLLNHDADYEGGIHNFPPFPCPVKFFFYKVCTLAHPCWWKYSTCDTSAKKRELFLERK